eukprot:2814485-Amphidinium_carterae.1
MKKKSSRRATSARAAWNDIIRAEDDSARMRFLRDVSLSCSQSQTSAARGVLPGERTAGQTRDEQRWQCERPKETMRREQAVSVAQ